jgi:AcrR family transcriptional regulator
MTKRQGYHHGDLAEALRDAALRLVDEHGPRGFTMKDAAASAGVSVAAPYRHFADRDDLLRSAALEPYRELVEDIEAVSEPDPSVRLGELLACFVAWAVKHRAAHRILFMAAVDKTGHAALVELSERATRAFLKAATQAAGEDGQRLMVSAYAIAQGHAMIREEPAIQAGDLIDADELVTLTRRAVMALARDYAS